MLFLCLFFSTFLVSRLGAQQITVCSGSGNATCLESKRICLSNGTTESCGNCTAGFIDFKRFGSTKGCQHIRALAWEEFVETVQPIYRNASLVYARLKRLYEDLEFISKFMAQIPPPVFSLGVNKFSADTDEDHKHVTGHIPDANAATDLGFGRFELSGRMLQSLPAEQDWEANGGTTPVEDQGRCGGCWSFSSMGVVEGAAFVTEGWTEALSVQQPLSCDEQNYGCEGGNVVYAMDYAVKNSFGGLATLEDYPFVDAVGTSTSPCDLQGKQVSARAYTPQVVVSYTDNSTFVERIQKVKAAVARQPISITVSTNCPEMMNYIGGVAKKDGKCACETVECIDHAVLLVGYNDNNNPPYWKIKNSWGTDWGDGGYIRISQQGGGNWGLFGLLSEGVLAVKAEEIPSSQGTCWGSSSVVVVVVVVWSTIAALLASAT